MKCLGLAPATFAGVYDGHGSSYSGNSDVSMELAGSIVDNLCGALRGAVTPGATSMRYVLATELDGFERLCRS